MCAGFDTVSSPRSAGDKHAQKTSKAVLVRDLQSCLPLSRILADGDLILLLTPVVPLPRSMANSPLTSDPFEPFGRALARHHPWIRHVPYTAKGGITSTHVGFIKRATAVIFVISGGPTQGQVSQVELSGIARSIGDQLPHIIVACCDLDELGPVHVEFGTLIHLPDYTPKELKSAADVLFATPGPSSSAGSNLQSLMLAPHQWVVERWNPTRDPGLDKIYELWCQCMPAKYHLTRFTFQSLISRDGWARHYIVREPETREILGFCATFITFIAGGTERLLGSLAAVLVRPSSRQRGIGLSLHDHALRQLTNTRDVERLQLGSTFPRLLYGLPVGTPAEDWFQRRGWRMDGLEPGTGQEVSDWLLRVEDWPGAGRFASATAGLTIKPCDFTDFSSVLKLVANESSRNDHVGWYDTYAKLEQTMHVRDIVIGTEGDNVIAAAITYDRRSGSPTADDLPWAAWIGEHVGGVTCICISGELLPLTRLNHFSSLQHFFADTKTIESASYSRDAIMIRLLDWCVAALSAQEIQMVFIDAISGGDEGFKYMGKILQDITSQSTRETAARLIISRQVFGSGRAIGMCGGSPILTPCRSKHRKCDQRRYNEGL